MKQLAESSASKLELQLKAAETMRQELINRATAHDVACKYAAGFFSLKDHRAVTYISEPWLAPGEVLNFMIEDGLSNLYRSPTRRGKETVWPVYYAKFVTEVLKLNGMNADVSPWNDEFEMQQIVDTFKNVSIVREN